MNQQQAAFRRKIIYLAVILGLFTVSMFWRGTLDIPLRGSVAAADRIASRTVQNQAIKLELRELDQGEPDLEGEARRLMLVGSKGLTVTILWSQAIEKQKRNDFHEMESLIRTITQLQPHFITPWIFQSWNIAYNVSVEMQGSGDMYYYIARGIELLAEGERRQGRTDPETGRKIGSPDMRWNIGFYYRNKFGVSDTVEVLRCLYQLSCISPEERDPKTFIDPKDGSIIPEKFEEFCTKHPHLVRRLRGESSMAYRNATDEQAKRRYSESLKCPTPESIIQFLRDNQDVPSRYKSAQVYKDADKQFPVLPPKFSDEEADPSSQTLDNFSAYHAARAWYSYSTVPVPPNQRDWLGKPLPLVTPRPGTHTAAGEYDPIKYRVPRQPMLIIFLQDGPRTQSYQAEMEQKEGWFDDSGWQIDDPADQPSNWWFPDPARPTTPKKVVVGRNQSTSLEEWRKALQMWEKEGAENGQILAEGQLQIYDEAARHRPPGATGGEPTPQQMDDPEIRKWYQASTARTTYERNQQVTNFQFFLKSARGESQEPTVQARKTLWKAEQQRKLGQKPEAIRLYKEGLEMWKNILLKNRDFQRPGMSDHTDEETYTFDLAYQRLLLQSEGVEKKAKEVANAADTFFSFSPLPFGGAKGIWVKENSPLSSPKARDVLEELKWDVVENNSPFAGVMSTNDDRNGQPWIPEHVKTRVRENQGIQRRAPGAPEGAPPPGG